MFCKPLSNSQSSHFCAHLKPRLGPRTVYTNHHYQFYEYELFFYWKQRGMGISHRFCRSCGFNSFSLFVHNKQEEPSTRSVAVAVMMSLSWQLSSIHAMATRPRHTFSFIVFASVSKVLTPSGGRHFSSGAQRQF